MTRKYIKISFLFIICISQLYSVLYSKSLEEILIESPLQEYLVDIELKELYSGMELIDCIYVINLDERINRWNKLRNIWEKKGFFVNRVNAVNGWNISKDSIKALSAPHNAMLGGVLGCFLSHISVLKNAYENQFEIIWVLEDDAEFVGDPQKIPELIKALSKLDPQWDILYTDVRNFGITTGGFGVLPVSNKDYLNKDFMRVGKRFGTYSILISKSGIQKLLYYFISNPLCDAIDVIIHWIPNIRKYAVRRNIVSYIRGTESTTQHPL